MKAYLLPKNKVAIECRPSDSGVVRRTVPGVRWSSTKNLWYASLSRITGTAVLALPGVECAEDLIKAVESAKCSLLVRPFPPSYSPKTVPYKHQLSGMAHLYGRDRSAVVSEPGTGKTKMAIDAMSAMHIDGLVSAVLIACPVSVRNTWLREFEMHCPVPYRVQMVSSTKDPDRPDFNGLNVLIVGVESLAAGGAYERCLAYMLMDTVPPHKRLMVVDEAHLIKTHNAKRTVNAKMLGSRCKYRWFLTGTPIANSIGDLYSLFDFLDPNIIGFPSYGAFMERYAVYGGYNNYQVVDWMNTDEILEATHPYMFKALKKDCLDLPPKVYVSREVMMEKEQERIYKALKKDKLSGNITTKGSLDLALRLHQVAGGWTPEMLPTGEVVGMAPVSIVPPKVAEVLEILSECDGQSVIVWCAYRHEVSALVKAISKKLGKEKVVEISGGVSESDRWEAVKAIQSGEARVMVGTAASGGVGITLTAASVVIYFSNTFKYVDRVQSEDRAHRLGQIRSVTIIDLVCPGTVDENIIRALKAKCDLSDWIVKGHSIQ